MSRARLAVLIAILGGAFIGIGLYILLEPQESRIELANAVCADVACSSPPLTVTDSATVCVPREHGYICGTAVWIAELMNANAVNYAHNNIQCSADGVTWFARADGVCYIADKP